MKTEPEKLPALIDTNVLVYAYAESSQNRKKAEAILDDCFSGKRTLAISLQNVGEFCDVALRKYGVDPDTVKKIATHLLNCTSFRKFAYSGQTLASAAKLFGTLKMGFWDAVLVSTMKENAIDTIYTEDDAFSKIEGIKAVNPFLGDRSDLKDFEELDKKIKPSETKRFLKR